MAKEFMARYCANCGSEFEDDELYCRVCNSERLSSDLEFPERPPFDTPTLYALPDIVVAKQESSPGSKARRGFFRRMFGKLRKG